LLDHDRIIADLKRHLTPAFVAERQQRYWTIFEKLREELGYADSAPGALRPRSQGVGHVSARGRHGRAHR
jgi:hypothetical protein